MQALRILLILGVGLLATACGRPAATKVEQGADPPQAALPRKLEARHLPNPWQIHEKVVSGGMPEGDEAFRELAALGVKTIISVDGAKPEVALAKKHGLRYVHLPHGYNGISPERASELAKAVRDLPGPIYLHCHHGKHRSPAAAAVACVGAGLIEPEGAVSFLQKAGTSESYAGLYRSAEAARRFESALLDELATEFPETAKVPPLAEAMVALEHTHDNLKAIAAAGWVAPLNQPDLDPAHEALILREHFAEMLRMEEASEQPEPFIKMLRESEADALGLENLLRDWKLNAPGRPPPAGIAAHFDRISASCKTCHTAYRDAPISPQK